MNIPGDRRPHPALLWGLVSLMTVFWTLNPVAGKVALVGFAPLLLVAVRTTCAALLILLVLVLKRPEEPVARRDWPALIALGVLQFGNQALFVVGLGHTSVAHVTLIFSTVPVLILCLAALIGQERITRSKLVGMAICVAGVVLLTLDQSEGQAATLYGDALIFGAICMFAMFTVLGKQQRERYGPIVMNAVAYSTGAIALQPVIWVTYRGFSFSAAPGSAWAALLFMASLSAVVGYLIYYWALGYAPASKIAVFQYLQPLLATAVSAVFLGEQVSSTLGLAGLVIVLGVFLTERG